LHRCRKLGQQTTELIFSNHKPPAMSLQRTTSTTLPIPIDNTAIPLPKLTFGFQNQKGDFPGGLFSRGSIRFSLNNTVMVNLATEAFESFSVFKGSASALNKYLLSLSITSNFEGGFDAINAYDKAGISIGFIQFARPESGAGKLLVLSGKPDLATKIKTRFGITDPHTSQSAMLARNDKSFLSEIVTASSTTEGIKAQFAMAINQNGSQQYFDKAFKKFSELNLNDPLCAAMLFDAAVNMGAGRVDDFKKPLAGQSDGDCMATNVIRFTREERRIGWQKIIAKNFA